MAVQGTFHGEVLDLKVGEKYVDFKLGQRQYDRPVLCSMRVGDFPVNVVKDGDRVTLNGRVMARKSKAGNAYESLFAERVEIDTDALAGSGLHAVSE